MKKIIAKVLQILSIILVVCFVVLLIIDYIKVYPLGSAPFYVYILVRTIEFVVPATICYIVSKVLTKQVD